MDLYQQARRYPWQLSETSPAIRYRELLESGLSSDAIHWRAGRGQLVRAHQGLYLRGTEPTVLDRIHAALLVAPAHATIGFHTAAMLYGFGVLPSASVHLLVPAGTTFPQRSGIVAHQVLVPLGDPIAVLGLPCAAPARCAVDLARISNRREALTVLDAALFSLACTAEDLAAEVSRHRRLRGIRQVRELLPLADGRAECRQETHLRLLLRDGGVRGLTPQVGVSDEHGRIRYRIDLADEANRVGVEYDGSSHIDRDRMYADRVRHNWLVSQGWTMHYFTATDLYQAPERVVEVVRAAQARRSRPYPHAR